jgi:hypothetical protein
MDSFKDIEGAEPGGLLSVSIAGDLHVVGIVESVDPEQRRLTFKGGRVVDFPADEQPEPEIEPEEEKGDAS